MAAKPYGVHPGPPGWTGPCASLCPLPLTNAGRAPWLRSSSQRQSGDGTLAQTVYEGGGCREEAGGRRGWQERGGEQLREEAAPAAVEPRTGARMAPRSGGSGLWAPASGAGRGHLGGRVRVTQQTLRGSRLLRGLCEPLAAKLAVLGGPQVKGRGSKAQDHLGEGLRRLGATRIWGWMVLCCGAVLPPAAPPASPTGRQEHPRPAV